MKKKYIAPSLWQTYLSSTPLLNVGSPLVPAETEDGDVTEEPGHDPGGALSRRRRNVWDDEEESESW